MKYADEAFIHDDLNEFNQPFYFYEFIADAERHGLQFVGEASSNDLQPGIFTPQVTQKMQELERAPEVVREQYKDFIRGSAFRQTLLCRKEIELAPDLLIERIPKLYASCDAVPQEISADRNPEITLFVRPGGAELETTHPLICAALKSLWSHWPSEVSFEALLATARGAGAAESTGRTDGDEAENLAVALARAYRSAYRRNSVSAW